MPRKTTSVATEEPIDNQLQEDLQPTETDERKVFTDWDVFNRAGLKLQRVTCQSYYPYHAYDRSCHTRMVIDPVIMKDHLDRDHGGGFEVILTATEKEWPGWKKFAELGIELLDFQCGVCQESIRLTPQTILRHMKPHTNANRRVETGGRFLMTIGYEAPIDAE